MAETDLGIRVHGDHVVWRRHQLLRSGFAPRLASRLAHDRRYDLHALIELTERGCAPELAARILAPIDDGPALG